MASTVKSVRNQRGVRHAPEVRQRCLDMILTEKKSPKAAALDLGLSDQTVYNWLTEAGARSRVEWYIPEQTS